MSRVRWWFFWCVKTVHRWVVRFGRWLETLEGKRHWDKESIAIAEACIADEPTAFDYRNRAVKYLDRNEYIKALGDLGTAIYMRTDKNDCDVYLMRGSCYLKLAERDFEDGRRIGTLQKHCYVIDECDKHLKMLREA